MSRWVSKRIIVTNSKVAKNRINDYDGYRTTLQDYTKDLFEKAEEPTAVVETVLNLVENESPKFNHPVGKGSSIIPAIQYLSFKTFENSVIKKINKFKKISNESIYNKQVQ